VKSRIHSLLLLVLASTMASCVCSGDTEWLTISFTHTCPYNLDGPVEYTPESFAITFIYGDRESLPEGAAELYRGEEQIPLQAYTQYVGRGEAEFGGNCEHNQTRFTSFEPLEPGEYIFVHRKKRGTGNPINCSPEWEQFDGSQAYVVPIEIVEPTGQSED
jgi:hypothetical protein